MKMLTGAQRYRPGRFLIGLGVLVLVLFPLFLQPISQVFARFFSPDGQMTADGRIELVSMTSFGAVILIGAGYGVNLAQDFERRERMKEIFFSDPLRGSPDRLLPPRRVLAGSTLTGLILIAGMLGGNASPAIFNFLYAKDYGLLDLFTPTLMLISAALILLTVGRVWRARRMQPRWGLVNGLYLGLSSLFIFDAGEETSWGQDFFHWRTPALFQGNLDHQTNLHNFFNAYFDYGYMALAVILLVVLFSAWLEYHRRWLPFTRLYLPHPGLMGLALLIAFVAVVWYPEQELLEEMVAAFALFYSLRIYRSFHPSQNPVRL